jgi:LysM repeat protein
MRPRLLFALAGGLLLGGLLGPGCTPDSSGSPPPSDTTAAPVEQRSQPSRPSAAVPSSAPHSPPADSARSVAQRLADASVAARVKQALARVQALRRFDFSPTVVRGHLVLRGDVDTREQYRRAGRVATNLEGVREITNQVTVQGRSPSDAGDAAEATYHTVRRGDTLTEIARAYGVSMQQLRALNDLSGALRPGQRIRVR